MFKIKKNYILIFVLSIILTIGFSVSAYASAVTGSQGYAVYRDGVLGSEWHAALMDMPTSAYQSPVTHIKGYGGMVKHASWLEFLDGNNNIFKGVYKPKVTIDAYSRGRVVDMGRVLATESIAYTGTGQISHNVASGYVQPNDVLLLRCDGVVEYCYEWFNFRIYGSDSKWDITLAGNIYHHSLANITPKKQAENWMTRIQTNTP